MPYLFKSGNGGSSSTTITNWQTFALVPNASGWGTISSSSIWSKRIGDSLWVQGSFKAGTTAGALASMVFPGGTTIDSSKMTSVAQYQVVGMANLIKSAAGAVQVFSSNQGLVVFYDGSTTDRVFVTPTAQSNVLEKVFVNAFQSSSDGIAFNFVLPVV
jgi:hypothetical protein